MFEEPEDPGSRSFFSEIISSVSDVKFSHNGRYLLTRDYLTAKVWDLNMDKGPVETYQVRKCYFWVSRQRVKAKVNCEIELRLNSDMEKKCRLLAFLCIQVHEYLRSKLCSLYENDCIFDKFECVWNSSDR